ncbi:hypothetical protein Tco_1384652 [Tanacetum coccineum]
MPSLPSPEPTVRCFDDLDFFKDFENKFPAIVYNDAQTSKSDLLTEPILSPQHIDEFDLNDETSVSEYDEEEQYMLYFNDLFPFNIIYLDDLKSEKDNDNNEIDIIQSSEGNEITHGSNVEGYTEEIVHDFEQRLETIFGRQVNRVHILDFKGLTPDMRQDLAERMRMVYTGDDGQEVFMSHAWRRLFGIRAPLVQKFILEFFSTCRIGDEMGLDVARTLCFQMGGARRSMMWRQFILALGLHTTEEMAEDILGARSLIYLHQRSGSEAVPQIDLLQHFWEGQAPEKVTATDLFYLRSMDRGAANVPYLLAQYLFRHAEGRKSGASCHFDMGELVKLNICIEIGDDWAWVAPGPERQQVAAAGAPKAAEDAPAVDEGGQAILAPVQAPQQPPPPPPGVARTMP